MIRTFALRTLCSAIVLPAALAGTSPSAAAAGHPNRSLLIVVDGLRPDYVTPELMPNLYALGERGALGERSFAVYPTYTRANGPAVVTGSYPGRNGLLHNHMYHPAMGEDSFSTGSAANLRRFDEATDGNLLTAPSLGELLDEAGRTFLSVSSGGTGNTLLHNHRGKGKGIWQVAGMFIPAEAEEEAIEALGELPGGRGPESTEWVVDAYLYHALGDDPPDVTMMWIGETDAAGHSHGVGAPETLEAVAHVDRHLGRLLAAHEEHGLDERVNIFLTSDHGFTQSTGGFNVGGALDGAGLSDGIRVVRNMVYLGDGDDALLERIVEVLQRDTNVGNIYTRPETPGETEGRVVGTLSTDLIQWNHERSADLIAAPAWTDNENEFGWKGTTTHGGTATHGSDSHYDLHIPLVAAGPDIKRGVRSSVPTGNVDFAPTILHLMGLEPPEDMDGRVMNELLEDGPAPQHVFFRNDTHRAPAAYMDGFSYEAVMEIYTVDGTVYLAGGGTHRAEPRD